MEIGVVFPQTELATGGRGAVDDFIDRVRRAYTHVAKAAAALDIPCGGRLRLGVGAGWNRVELEAMGGRYPGQRTTTPAPPSPEPAP